MQIEYADLLPNLFQLVGKVAGSLHGLPVSVRKRLSRGRGGSNHNTHNDSSGEHSVEVDFGRVLQIGKITGPKHS